MDEKRFPPRRIFCSAEVAQTRQVAHRLTQEKCSLIGRETMSPNVDRPMAQSILSKYCLIQRAVHSTIFCS
eukprot:9475740-Pyramimonas_sp.AAC.1